MMRSSWLAVFVIGSLWAANPAISQGTVGACQFNPATLSFAGSRPEQARCLLRPIAIGGVPGPRLSDLPPTLGRLFTSENVETQRDALRRYLSRTGLGEAQLGGSLNAPVSRARGGVGEAPLARYFVIHDTSAPYLRDRPFPPNVDTDSNINNLNVYRTPSDTAVAHIFVNRRGETFVGHDFGIPWRATRLETRVIGEPSKGLFLHIELVQPRRRDPANTNPSNDRFAPDPGFSQAQYEKLGLLYVVASVRAGAWLVPAFHAALDEGIPGGHDDPQNFQLTKFDRAIEAALSAISGGG